MQRAKTNIDPAIIWCFRIGEVGMRGGKIYLFSEGLGADLSIKLRGRGGREGRHAVKCVYRVSPVLSILFQNIFSVFEIFSVSALIILFMTCPN